MRIKQKEKIVLLLRAGSAMTQGELAEAIYGDSFHTSNIYSALMALVNEKVIMRLDGSLQGTLSMEHQLFNRLQGKTALNKRRVMKSNIKR